MSETKPPEGLPEAPLSMGGLDEVTPTDVAPIDVAPIDVAPKLRSQPVLSVGTPSPPQVSQALASAPAARVSMPSAPLITTRDDSSALLVTTPSPGGVASGQQLIVPPSHPRSDPPTGSDRPRQDSQPPGRRLAPPPKPRRDSSPTSEAPPEGQAQLLPPLPPLETPSFAPPVTPEPSTVPPVPAAPAVSVSHPAAAPAVSVSPPATAPAITVSPAAAPAVTVPAPAAVAHVSTPPAATPLVASVPPRPVATPPRPGAGTTQPGAPAAGGLPQILPAAPAAAAASSPPPANAAPLFPGFPPAGAATPLTLASTPALSDADSAPISPPPSPPSPDLATSPATSGPRSSPPPPPPAAFVAPSPVPAASTSPGDLGLEPGGPARVTPPQRQSRPPPRSSEPPPPAHVIVPSEVTPLPSKPTPAPAIQVMRIIAIGNPTVAKPPEVLDDDVEEIAEEAELEGATTPLLNLETTVPLAEPAIPAELGEIVVDTTELDEADLAPDSQESPKAAAEALQPTRDDASPRPPGEVVADAPAADVKPPPPPPRRPQPPKRPDSGRPRARRALKRPWWEELFGEDFSRAVPRLTEKQITREVDFIEESLGVAKGGVVLDLGCGSGHHAVELASRGYGVVGYDLSVYQLALAADVAQERDQRINFLQGDMREMAFEAMFDGIYCWNTTFGFFEEDKNIAVAERVFNALKPGGMFLLDMANRDFAAAYSPSQLWYEGDSCVCMDDMNVDFITSRLRVKRSVIFDDGRSRECVYSIRLYSLHELGKLLHDVGFRVTEASGQTATPGVFFGEHSPRLIVLAQKP